MSGTRSRHPDAFAVKPLFHVTPRYCHRLGALEDPWIGYYAQIRQQTLPRQPHSGISAQPAVKPTPRLLVPFRAGIGSVDQNVGIDQDHVRLLPPFSISSNTSQMLSRFASRHGPISIGLVRKGLRDFGRLSSLRPRRRAELTACLKVKFCLARQTSSWADTSSSR